MANPKTLKLVFAPLAEQLDEQLARQGLEFIDCTHHQADADAIARLFVRGLLTEGEATKAWKRLRNAMVKHIEYELRRGAKP